VTEVITKGKKKKKKKRTRDDAGTPQHAAAEATVEHLAAPDVDKGTLSLERLADDHNQYRTSEPLTNGHQFPSPAGDHGRGQGRNSAVAFDHPDLRQSSTSFDQILARLRTVRGNVLDLGVSDSTPGGYSHAGEVALASFDQAARAGSYRGMQSVDHDPLRQNYHQAASGSGSNGSHSLSNPVSRNPYSAAKSESALDIMKRTQRVISG